MKNRQNRQKKAQPLPVLFICISVLPAVILTLMFTIWPTVQALYLSFTNATSLGLNNKFVGLDNYIYMFHDKSFIQALKNTAKLMAVVPVITIFCSLVLAFVLNQCKLKEMVLYRTIFYFPNIVSLTVVGIIWSFVFHPNVGIVNKILGAVGLESLQRSWLGDSKTALWCIAFTLLWQAAGYYMVMHIAAMDGISPEIYESATLDGASAWRKLISITMPLMKDIIGITFVLALSGTINLSFVLSQVMTGGGPNGASSVLLQYMYTQGFVNGNFGYAMAITVFTLAISVALSMLSRKLTKIRAKVIKWVTRLFLILVAIIMLYPLAWNVVSSFKTSTEFLTDPFAWPQGLAWDNYVRAYEKSNLAANIGNSIYVVLETLVIIVVCVVPCSYCLVRYKFPGAKLILNIYMAAIFIQATYIMIPLFLQMNKLNLLNSLTALGVLYATMQFPFAIFLLTGFLRSIPRDYEEAAMIDGCGPFRILTSIIIPMCKPGIVTVCMISAMAAWNEYPVALVMVTDPTKATLPVGLANLYEIQRYATDWGALFAALVLALIPTVILFIVGQKQLVQGLSVGGVKG